MHDEEEEEEADVTEAEEEHRQHARIVERQRWGGVLG